MTNDLTAIVEDVLRLGLLQDAERVEAHGDGVGIRGQLSVGGRMVTLTIELGASFPGELPKIRLDPWNSLGFIPHVSQDGTVCFAEPEGLLLDIRRPVELIQESVERAVALLNEGALRRNVADFAEEFEWYWRQIDSGILLCSLLAPDDRVAQVIIVEVAERGSWLCRDRGELSSFFNGKFDAADTRVTPALFVPLEPGSAPIPPRSDRRFWNAADARSTLLPCLSKQNQSRLRKELKRNGKQTDTVIFSLPRNGGGHTLFGLRYEGRGGDHPLHAKGTARTVKPVHIVRLDKHYMTDRGGANSVLQQQRVLVVGCGSVGGVIAVQLAKAGVGDLTLLDHDALNIENTFRHVLGKSAWLKNKAVALKEHLEAELPYVQVTAVPERLQDVMRSGSVDLTKYDLIVSALGNPTIELQLNQDMHAAGTRTPVVYTWLEPLGLGGHALLVSPGSEPGCLECLYTSLDPEQGGLENRAAFAASGQRFGKDLSGCGSLYTPYGFNDAVETAILASRLGLDFLLGREAGNPLRSWKGNPDNFQRAGFLLSDRHAASATELTDAQYANVNQLCRVCGRHEEPR